MLEITLTIIMLYIFSGIALIVGAILIGQRHPEKFEDDDGLFGYVRYLAVNKPLELLCAILLFGIIWLPMLIVVNNNDDDG